VEQYSCAVSQLFCRLLEKVPMAVVGGKCFLGLPLLTARFSEMIIWNVYLKRYGTPRATAVCYIYCGTLK